MSVPLSTYGARQPGRVRLDVLDAGAHLVARAAPVEGQTLVDNAERVFALPAPVCAA